MYCQWGCLIERSIQNWGPYALAKCLRLFRSSLLLALRTSIGVPTQNPRFPLATSLDLKPWDFQIKVRPQAIWNSWLCIQCRSNLTFPPLLLLWTTKNLHDMDPSANSPRKSAKFFFSSFVGLMQIINKWLTRHFPFSCLLAEWVDPTLDSLSAM